MIKLEESLTELDGYLIQTRMLMIRKNCFKLLTN